MRLRVALVLLVTACSETPRPIVLSPGTPEVAVMSYNVNFGIPGDAPTIDIIRKGGADVVFLQETNLEWERALRRELGAIYPHMAFHDDAAAGGLAVLSKRPFEVVEQIPSPVRWFPAWRVRVQTPLGPLQVLSVHLHPPVSEGGSWVAGYFTTGPVRRAEMAEYVRHLDPRLPTLVVGDFNENDDGHAAMLLARAGFASALAKFAPDAPTWRWDTAVGRIRLRLDHVEHDARLLPIRACVVDGGNSDHLAALATFVRATAPRTSSTVRAPLSSQPF